MFFKIFPCFLIFLYFLFLFTFSHFFLLSIFFSFFFLYSFFFCSLFSLLWEWVLSRIHNIPFYGIFHTEYENLLKELVIFNPIKGSPLEEIIKDSWMNMSHEEELMPYTELLPDYKDPGQTQLMVSMAYTWEGIHDL